MKTVSLGSVCNIKNDWNREIYVKDRDLQAISESKNITAYYFLNGRYWRIDNRKDVMIMSVDMLIDNKKEHYKIWNKYDKQTIINDNDLDDNYLFHYLDRNYDDIVKFINSGKSLNDFMIILPSLEKQKELVQQIDTINNERNKTKGVINELTKKLNTTNNDLQKLDKQKKEVLDIQSLFSSIEASENCNKKQKIMAD